MALRDYLLAPPAARDDVGVPGEDARLTHRLAPACSLGVLAPARDLPALAAAAGLALSRGAPAALVHVHLADLDLAPPLVPSRPAASRLARSLAAQARGRLVLTFADREHLPAAPGLATVVAVAARDPDIDVLLAAQDAIVVALPPTADPDLAERALAGAASLTRAVGLSVRLDPMSRALALGGIRAPGALARVVRALA